MKKILLSTLLFISIFCNAQKLSQSSHGSYYTYVYQLSHHQTKNLYVKGWSILDSTYLTKVVDSFLTAKPNTKKLPLGNYLFVQSQESYIHYKLEESSNIWVNVVNNDRDLQIVVQDTTGKIISDAEVYVEGEKIKFDKKLNLYHHPKSYKNGLLTISYQGNSVFKSLNAHFRKQFWRKIYYKSRLAWVWYHLKKPFKDIYRVTKNRYDKAKWIRRIIAIFDKEERDDLKHDFMSEKMYKARDKSWKGYHVFSKPKYRPRDTVKFKMYLLDYKNIPVNEPVNVYLMGYIKGKYQTIKLKQIKPYQAGGYVLDFVLADSLQLQSGQRYSFDFRSKSYEKWDDSDASDYQDDDKQAGKRRAYFIYEDYELASIIYNMRLAKSKHNEDEVNHIYVSAKDENDLPQPDAKVEVIITPQEIFNFKDQETFIKDTLWQHNQSLDAVGETKISIPDSIFKNTHIKYKVETIFLNSSNERIYKSSLAERVLEEAPIDFLAIKDSVTVRYFNSKKYNQPATLITKDIFGQIKSKKIIHLPYVFKKSEKEIYHVENYQKRSYTYDALSNNAGISCYAEQTKDSLFVVIQNPRNTPVWYYIFEGNTPHFADFSTENVILKQKSNAKKTYFVSLSYWWENRIHKEDYVTSLYTPKDQFNINLYAPKKIIPGAKTTIEASVTDANNKPITDVDVTIYGITGKFKEFSHSSFDFVQAKKTKAKNLSRKQYNSFELRELIPQQPKNFFNHFLKTDYLEAKTTQNLLWRTWKKHLDTIEYYKFLYPKDNFYLYEQPSKNDVTQFAPYVTKNGKLDSIYYVLLDEIPVYASFTVSQPYSFKADTNKHTIKIRTKNSLINIQNIRFKPQFKTIFSIENLLDKRWKKNQINVEITKQKNILSNNEILFLQKFLIGIDTKWIYTPNTYFQQEENIVNIYNRYPSHHHTIWAGFFNPSERIKFIEHDAYEISFFFRGGYHHSFDGNVVMVENKNFPVNPQALPSPTTFDDEVYTLQSFKNTFETFKYPYTNSRASWDNLKTALIISQPPQQDSLKHIVLMTYKGKMVEELRLYRPNATIFDNLALKKTYHLIYLYGDHHHRKLSVNLSESGLLFKKIDHLPLLKNDSSIYKLRASMEKEYQYKTIDNIRLDINTDAARNIPLPIGKNIIIGYILDEKGRPIPGASVYVKGNVKIGTITDIEGLYTIYNVPENATLVVTAVDYKTIEVATKNQKIINLSLEEDAIQEIQVVSAGYEKLNARSITGSVTIESSRALQGRTTGVVLRGVGSVNSGTEPLYIVDGIPIAASDFAKLNPTNMESIEVLKDGAAVAVYGAQGANGVIVVTTKKAGGTKPANKLPSQTGLDEATANNLEGSGLRSNFRDDAVWQPYLRTNKEGKVSFTTTFPDDITRWDLYALAGKQGGLFASTSASIKASKQLTAMLSMPRFAVIGDSIEVVGKSTNYTNDTLAIKTRFEIDKKIVSSKEQKIVNGLVEKQWLITENKDSLGILYALDKGDYTDGELRKLPIYPKGTKESKGYFINLYKDSSVIWKFDKDKGTVQLHVSADMLKIMETELLHLKEYSYLCNEQAASKLLAYLMQERICTLKGTSFLFKKDVRTLIERLQKNINPDGLWGWWGVSNTTHWVSKHVIKALLEAKKQGYGVQLSTSDITKLYVTNLESDTLLARKLENLELLDQIGAEVNYPQYLNFIEEKCFKNKKDKKKHNLLGFQEYLSLQILKQKYKLPYNLDTLKKTRKTTMYGNHYWGEIYVREGNEIIYNSTQTTLKALQLLQNASKNNFDEQVLAVNYILEQRNNNGYWLHTYESISALEAIYPYIANSQGKIENPVIELSGGVSQTVSQYPFEATFKPDKDLRIRRNQKTFSPVYITAYQQFWNDKPEKLSSGFEVKSYFGSPNTSQKYLEAGKPVELVVEVNAKQTQDYVLVEIPIPAGCSYDDKNYKNHNWDKQKHKICIFLDRMSGGVSYYRINLIPRYTGIYTLNPAKVEMMYKPTFIGRETLKKVVIKEKNL